MGCPRTCAPGQPAAGAQQQPAILCHRLWAARCSHKTTTVSQRPLDSNLPLPHSHHCTSNSSSKFQSTSHTSSRICRNRHKGALDTRSCFLDAQFRIDESYIFARILALHSPCFLLLLSHHPRCYRVGHAFESLLPTSPTTQVYLLASDAKVSARPARISDIASHPPPRAITSSHPTRFQTTARPVPTIPIRG